MSAPPPLSRTALGVHGGVFAELAPHIEAFARRGGDLVSLHIGDTHFAPPPDARFSLAESAPSDVDVYRYGSTSGVAPLKDAFAAYLSARAFGPAALDAARHVVVTCGATHALFCAARAVLDPGDHVLVAAPYWPLAVGVLRAAGGAPIEVPFTTRLYEDPSADPTAALDEALTPSTRAIYVTTPNNPDGKVLSPEHLASIARWAVARGVWVLADEVYAENVYDGAHGSVARHDGMAERTMSVYSLSKSHALAGARVGFAVGPEHAIEVARRIATHTVFNVPVAAQRVALAAIRADPSWMADARRGYRAARDSTVSALAPLVRAGARAFTPEGGSYVFIDFGPILAGRPLRSLLERAIEHGVLLCPGESSGGSYRTWARLCFTSAPRDRVIEGVARLRAAVDDFGV